MPGCATEYSADAEKPRCPSVASMNAAGQRSKGCFITAGALAGRASARATVGFCHRSMRSAPIAAAPSRGALAWSMSITGKLARGSVPSTTVPPTSRSSVFCSERKFAGSPIVAAVTSTVVPSGSFARAGLLHESCASLPTTSNQQRAHSGAACTVSGRPSVFAASALTALSVALLHATSPSATIAPTPNPASPSFVMVAM